MATPIADMVQDMLFRGISAEVIVSAIRAAEQHAQSLVAPEDELAKRRARDRERKRKKAVEASAESSGTPSIKKKDTLSPELELEGKKESIEIARAREAKATRLPDDWQPSIDDLAFAKSVLPAERVRIETEKFRDYWHARAGPGALKRSWPATWRNWCRKAAESTNGGGNGPHRNGSHAGTNGGESFAARAVRQARELAAGMGPGSRH